MTERQLKKLGRTELLEILLSQSREMDDLKKRMAEAEEKLKAREAVMAEAEGLAAATAELKQLILTVQAMVEQPGHPGQGSGRRVPEPEAVVEEQLKELDVKMEEQLTQTLPYVSDTK